MTLVEHVFKERPGRRAPKKRAIWQAPDFSYSLQLRF